MWENLFNKYEYINEKNTSKRYSERCCNLENINLKTSSFELFRNDSLSGFNTIISNTKAKIYCELRYFKNSLIILIGTEAISRHKFQSLQSMMNGKLCVTLYKYFIIYIVCKYLYNRYTIQPYGVGKGKKSLAMVLPSEVVKSLKINSLSVFLLLQVKGVDNLELKIIREEDGKNRYKRYDTC